MAFTATKAQELVFGNQRVWQGVVTCDAVDGDVSVGMSTILHAQATPKSITTTATSLMTIKLNQTKLGVASQGQLALTGAVSGDDYFVIIYGR